MKIFINAGHFDDPATPWIEDPGAVFTFPDGTKLTDGGLAIKIRDVLKTKRPQWVYVPDNLNLPQSIAWVNTQATPEDLAIDIHMNFNGTNTIRGAEAYYATDPTLAKLFSAFIADALGIPDRGAKPDSQSAAGSLGWLRLMKCKSVIVECGYLSNIEDRNVMVLPTFAEKSADGIIKAVETLSPHPPTSPISHKEEIRAMGERLIQISKEIP